EGIRRAGGDGTRAQQEQRAELGAPEFSEALGFVQRPIGVEARKGAASEQRKRASGEESEESAPCAHRQLSGPRPRGVRRAPRARLRLRRAAPPDGPRSRLR